LTHKHSCTLSHTHTHTHAHTLSHARIAAFPQKEKNAQRISGVGLVLERPEGSGLLIVKGLTKDGIAELDGRISVNDTLLKVCASRPRCEKSHSGCPRTEQLPTFGRVASGGALAPEPPRATRSQPEFMQTRISPKTHFPPGKIGLSLKSG